MPTRFERYVAIGDSSTEGLVDPDGRGGYRGWSMRLAERIALHQGSLLYANLAIRGRRTRQIRDEQLEPAVAMRPDLATVFSGTNDVVGQRFDAGAVADDMTHIQRVLIEAGATVLTFTLPALALPLARSISSRVVALNEALRGAAASTGAILLDFAIYPVATDARLWSGDRIHANAAGHARIADALAHALRLPGTDDSWNAPLPDRAPRSAIARVAAELGWVVRYVLPWALRSAGGGSDADGRQPKRPRLEPILGARALDPPGVRS